MGKAENEIEKYFDKMVVERGGFTRKYTSPGRRGVTDRIMFLAGTIAFVELKTPIGQLSTLQVKEIQRMTNQGAICAVLTSKNLVDQFFAALDKHYADEFKGAININFDLLRPL